MTDYPQTMDRFPTVQLFVSRQEGWSHPADSNRRPTDYESVALPTELGWPVNKFEDLQYQGVLQMRPL